MEGNLEFYSDDDSGLYKDLNPDSLVRQDNRLINGRWKMNLNQTRIILASISLIEAGDNEFEGYRIKGQQLIKLLDLKGNSLYNQLKEDVPKLMSTFIEINHSDKDKEWISLVSSARYINGDLILKFSNEMKPYLLNLKAKFTQFKLMDAMKFKSMYALRLFLLLKQFDSTGWRYLTIEELRESMNLNAKKDNDLKVDMYPKVNDFKKRVLEPAIAELNKTGFTVNVVDVKDSRKIVAFKFYWKDLVNLPEKIIFTPVDDSAEKMLLRMKALKLNDRQIKYLGGLIPKKIITAQELQQTVWAIEQAIKTKEIPENKKGGYAYTTFKNKFNLTDF